LRHGSKRLRISPHIFRGLRREEKVREQPTTIAILGADTVVGSALRALLEGHGYRTVPLDTHPTGVVDELLSDADLLLLAPRLEEDARDAFLGAMGKNNPQGADLPVIALFTAVEEGLLEKEGALRVPWPCETRALVERIEAVLLDTPEASAAPTTQETQTG
jgi:hypothetical protein